MDFWGGLDQLLATQDLIIERPKGSRHPRYNDAVYPLDYGHLQGTTSNDGCEIDVWRGSLKGVGLVGVICTADLKKKDAELKLLVDCTDAEMQKIEAFHNVGMVGLLIKRPMPDK